MKKITLIVIALIGFATNIKAQDTTVREDYRNADAKFLNPLANFFKNDYISLKNALVESDIKLAQVYGEDLTHSAGKMEKLMAKTELLEDQKKYAQSHFDFIKKQEEVFISGKNIEDMRKAFENISQSMYYLMKTFKPNAKTIYKQYCPMAFDGKGAYWLSDEEKIMNPYFGFKMLHCGSVEEEL